MIDARFPELTNQQVEKLKGYGIVENFEIPTTILDYGDKRYDFFVVLEGGIKIIDPEKDKGNVTIHGRHQFSGSSSILSHRAIGVRGETLKNTQVIRIKPDQLKKAISKFSDISDLLLNAFLLREESLKNSIQGVKLIGSEHSNETYAIRDFMDKNDILYTFVDSDKDDGLKSILEAFDLKESDLPVMINSQNEISIRPSIDEIGECSGVRLKLDDEIYDVLVIGAGPAGLAASVYASSEGLKVLTIDSNSPGGQAGKSSKIENYLGFPTGISGRDLANNGYIQAQKFGCTISVPHRVESIQKNAGLYEVNASNTSTLKARTVIAATGAAYRRLPLDGIEKYEGAGIYYSATSMHANMCKNSEIGIVGGGNSAGQAALFLANYAHKVYIIIRKEDIGAKMSDYLVQRIIACENIEVLTNSNVVKVDGDTYLEKVDIKQKDTLVPNEISYLFTFVGAKPCTEWLDNIIDTDAKGFVHTGLTICDNALNSESEFSQRKPYTFETSLPGLFAVGDVRSGSVKRVASAVGEGSIVVSDIHKFLAQDKFATTTN
ncbi:thioredoxin reductase (NADPH) [Maribacter spongiicola]|uniref:Thioredoxin reductase (NADPH) n=1 Tax=Maribacter spongiicola TaxID=1206753 RepID=A0A4R7K6L8_9FLAO|nr:FAD-dependent oxidoreductase [Maribacter spongiicola]TDT45299.1 thioredoxin reductase (NADPH) [Maribacter spongiicola]